MRSLLSVTDIENEVETILNIASDFKAGKIEEKPLEGQKISYDLSEIINSYKSFL